MSITLLIQSLLTISPSAAQEQEESGSVKYELEEYVIVGTPSVEKIIDIPYSVFRVDEKELPYGKKISAKDVLVDVPGLFLRCLRLLLRSTIQPQSLVVSCLHRKDGAAEVICTVRTGG